MTHKIPVGVLGASGYTGRELCALVARHPRLSLRFAAAHGQRGQSARLGGTDVTFVAAEDAPLGQAALVFTALPHGASAMWAEAASAAGAKVVDLANDRRPGTGVDAILPSAGVIPGASGGVPYGLTEVTRAQVRAASLVANPGCYATAILLALLPLLEAGLVAPGATIVADAASGVTGAGASPKPELLFGEVTENFRPYAVGNGHKHLDELRAVIGDFGTDADLLFTPHLLPVARGIVATITVPLTDAVADPLGLWRARYAGEPFVEVSAAPPALRDVVGRNVARIHAVTAQGVRRPTLIVVSAIDNLLKGAAGQALQNANLMLGLDEAAGLPT